MKLSSSTYIIIILLILLNSCQKTKKEPSFILDGKSELRITNQSTDSLKISISNWVYLPVYEEKVDTIIAPNRTIELIIVSPTKHYFNVTVENKEYRVFAATGKKIEVSITPNGNQLAFTGELKEINEFLKTRAVHSDYSSRRSWHQGKGSISELVKAMDAITDSQKDQLKKSTKLPSWYKDFESMRLDFVNAESKLSAMLYRKKLLAMDDSIPSDYLRQVTSNLSIEESDFIGIWAYMKFLNTYLYCKKDPFMQDPIPNSQQDWIASSMKRIRVIEENIKNERLKGIIHTHDFLRNIEVRRDIWDDQWLKYILEPELSALIKQQIIADPILPKGAKLPYFYLPDLDSTYYEPKNFKGNVLLINFWATWCKPCYQEFEHENKLVERFKGETVEIINICLDS